MARTIPPIDLTFLLTETPNSPKHVGAALVFDLPPTAGAAAVRRIVRHYRAATPIAPFTYVPEMLARTGPAWREVEHVDMNYHVQHLVLPAGSSYEDFLHVVEDLHESVLDRNRPLFRVWLIEGLPGNQLGMYLKVHHAVIDGMSAMMRINASLSTSSAAALQPPFYAVELSSHAPRATAGALQRISALNAAARRQTSALRDLSLGVLRKSIGRLFARGRGGSLPFTAPNSVMNDPIRTPRSLATLMLPLAEMKSVGQAFDATINDVAATIVDAGIHAYLKRIDRTVGKRLVAMCPVSLRASDDKRATTQATVIFAPLGEPAADIGERIEQVVRSMRSGKDEVGAMGKDAAIMYAISAFGLGEAAEVSRLGRVAGHLANLVLSNVPGSREPLYLDGAALTGVYPISALGAGIGLNVTLASHAGTMGFGFLGNGMALPDLPLMAKCTGEAFEKLKKAAARRAAAAARGQATKARKARPNTTPRRAAPKRARAG
jgi:WS/DGAT/MGAT family acyltransferase